MPHDRQLPPESKDIGAGDGRTEPASNQTPMVCCAGPARRCGDGRGRGGAVRPRSMGLRTVAENGPCPESLAPRMGSRSGGQGTALRAVRDGGRLDIAVAPHPPPTTSPPPAPTDAGRQAEYGCLVSAPDRLRRPPGPGPARSGRHLGLPDQSGGRRILLNAARRMVVVAAASPLRATGGGVFCLH